MPINSVGQVLVVKEEQKDCDHLRTVGTHGLTHVEHLPECETESADLYGVVIEFVDVAPPYHFIQVVLDPLLRMIELF